MNIPRITEAMEYIDERYILSADENNPTAAKRSWIKYAVIAACFTVCVALAAFGYTLFDSNDYLPDYDVDPSYMLPEVMLASYDDNYFGIIRSSRGMYLARNDGSGPVPLCQKEGCDHTDIDCDARLWWGFTGISAYDGRVYWASTQMDRQQDSILINSCALDGSDLRTEKEIPWERASLYSHDFIRAHRGYMYFAGGVDGYSGVRVTAEELSENGESLVIFEKSYEGKYINSNIQFYANTIYIMINSFNMKDDFHTNNPFHMEYYQTYNEEFEVYEYDIRTGKTKQICNLNRELIDVFIDAEGNIYHLEDNPENGFKALWKLSTNTKKDEMLYDFSEEDPDYKYFNVVNGYVVATMADSDDICVKDFDGNTTILSIKPAKDALLEEYDYFVRAFIGNDGKNLFFYCNDQETIAAVPLDGSDAYILIADTVL